jgi:hypothetical protein
MLTVTYAKCHIKVPYAECHYTECRYAEGCFAECRGPWADFSTLKDAVYVTYPYHAVPTNTV